MVVRGRDGHHPQPLSILSAPELDGVRTALSHRPQLILLLSASKHAAIEKFVVLDVWIENLWTKSQIAIMTDLQFVTI